MDDARKSNEERFDVQVNVTPRGGAQVLVRDKTAGYSEVFCYSPREVELMLLTAGNDVTKVSRHLADYTLKVLFLPRAQVVPGAVRPGPDGAQPMRAPDPSGGSPAGRVEGLTNRHEGPSSAQTFDEETLAPLLNDILAADPGALTLGEPREKSVDESLNPRVRIESPLEALERELVEAVRLEDYARASRLRDEIAARKWTAPPGL